MHIQNYKEKWKLLDAYPGLINLLLPMGSDDGARIVKVDGNNGKIIRDLNDVDAKLSPVGLIFLNFTLIAIVLHQINFLTVVSEPLVVFF